MISSITAISDLKKRSHGYVNTKPKLIPKKKYFHFFFFDSIAGFINLSYIKTIWDPSLFIQYSSYFLSESRSST